jgi:hypothetical protein
MRAGDMAYRASDPATSGVISVDGPLRAYARTSPSGRFRAPATVASSDGRGRYCSDYEAALDLA